MDGMVGFQVGSLVNIVSVVGSVILKSLLFEKLY
jgi:hypothetical protein